MAFVLLAVAAAILGFFVRDDIHEFARFKALATTGERQRRYRIWMVRAFALFIGFTLVALLLLGRVAALWRFPGEFADAARAMPAIDISAREAPMAIGLILGAMIGGGVIGTLAARRGKAGKPVMLGDVDALLPRNGAEIAHGALLALNAGVTEELFFRLCLPLLLILCGVAPVAAFVVAAAIFGLVHLYQGWIGVAATAVIGAVMTIAYLLSGSLLLPILLHVAIDLNALVLRPALGLALARRSD